MSVDLPVLISFGISLLGIWGSIAALIALYGVKHEQNQLLRFQKGPSTELLQLVSNADFRPANWLKEKGLDVSSHLGDQVLAIYGGWTLGRPPGLAELHNLWTRRERSRFSARVAGGIAATLLICGIAGTLSSVHPILQTFKVVVDSNGAAPEASQSAANVMAMVRGLGRAFYPSLTALAWTLIVVLCRGLYAHRASALARDLDRLTIDYFFRSFRPRTLGEEFSELALKLTTVADRISERDTAFAEAAKSLEHSIGEIKDLGPVVKKAGEEAARASTRLAKDTTNVVSAFGEHLGKNSPLFTAVDTLAVTANKTDESVNHLVEVSSELTSIHRDSLEAIAGIATILQQTLGRAPEYVQAACLDGTKDMIEAGRSFAADAKHTVDAIVERLGRLIATTTGEVEATTTTLKQTVSGISQTVSDGFNGTVSGLLDAIQRTTNDLNNTASRVDRTIAMIGQKAESARSLEMRTPSRNKDGANPTQAERRQYPEKASRTTGLDPSAEGPSLSRRVLEFLCS